MFNDKAIKTISNYSNGLLRRINILADKALLASYAANENIVTAKHVKLAANETEFFNQQRFPAFRWSLLSVLFIVYLPNMNLSSFVMNNVNLIEESSPAGIEASFRPSKQGNASLMLVKEARESIEAIPEANRAANAADENTESNVTDLTRDEVIIAAATNKLLQILSPDVSMPRPDPSELALSQWQSLEKNVYFYPETVNESVVTKIEENIRNNELLEIRDLIKAVSEHNEDEIALLNQLMILPSETAINHETVASGLTCKRCSTIIYRPLKDDKKL